MSAGLLFAICGAMGQPATGKLSFEVASVKPAEAISAASMAGGKLQIRVGTQIDGARVDIGMTSLAQLVSQAYGLKNYQVTGPEWMSSERYDIHAKLPEGATKEQVPEMLQSLLAKRFKLTFHRESKEHQVYALIAGKGGLKLKEAEPDPPPTAAGDGAGSGPATGGGATSFAIGGAGGGQTSVFSMAGAGSSDGKTMVYSSQGGTTKAVMAAGLGMHLDRKMTMQALCDLLGRFVDRPLIDMTGLTATYQVALDIPVDELKRMAMSGGANVVIVGNPGAAGGGAGDSASEPSGGSAIFANLQQMGLKIETRKAPLDLLVVDHAEKVPTEN